MVHFEKSQPAPDCLEFEKCKKNGNYKCGTVLERIKNDFKNKCYICEYKEPITINVEHFIPHEGDNELKFSWDNLFLSCGHCNNTKLAKYNNILNCTCLSDKVDTDLKYIFKPFPYEKVKIEVLRDDERVHSTKDLLIDVFNGTTTLKKIEASNLRNKLLDEIMDFQESLKNYFLDTNTEEDKTHYLRKIRGHLNKASNFTAFKRWIIWDNERLNEEFGQYI
jgi:HNH endonuclease.